MTDSEFDDEEVVLVVPAGPSRPTSEARAAVMAATGKAQARNRAAVVRWSCPVCDAEMTGESNQCSFCGTERTDSITKGIQGESTAASRGSRACSKGAKSSTRRGNEEENDDDDGATARVKKSRGRSLAAAPLSPKLTRPVKKPKPQEPESLPWTDRHGPRSIEDLKGSLDKKRVETVQESIVAGIDGIGPRLLVLHGPTGAGKSTCVKVIAKELGFAVRDWDEEAPAMRVKRGLDEGEGTRGSQPDEYGVPYQRQVDLFSKFISDCCYPSLALGPRAAKSSSSSAASSSSSSSSSVPSSGTVVLLESLPRSKVTSVVGGGRNTMDLAEAQDILFQHVQRISYSRGIHVCIVYILTVDGGSGASPTQIQEAVGEQNAAAARAIGFNPVSATRVLKALKSIAAAEGLPAVPEKDLSALADGDLRNAINNLQFLSLGTDRGAQGKKQSRKKDSKGVPSLSDKPAISRDSSFEMCYAVGKLLRGPKLGEAKFHPETVARNCALEPSSLAAFMYENFYKYASAGNCDVRAYGMFADHLSFADVLLGHKWHVLDRALESGGEEVDACDALAESVLARSASCWQRFVEGEVSFSAMVHVTKPQMFESNREAQRTTDVTRQYLRAHGDCSSAGIFVRDVLPFSTLITTSHDGLNQSRFPFSRLPVQQSHRAWRKPLDEDDLFADPSLFMEEDIEDGES